MDFSNVMVPEDDVDGELAQLTSGSDGSSPKAIPPIWSEVSGWFVSLFCYNRSIFCYFYCLTSKIFWQVMKFLTNPHKPMILALSRPDPKKNITTLLKAFGECRPLKDLANLVSCAVTQNDSIRQNYLMLAKGLIRFLTDTHNGE